MDKKTKPRFSVVIPAYNEAHYIADTIDSLNKQVFRDFEIIVVDNNSTDKTATIAKSLGAKVIKEKNPGVCWARQAGTEVAQGEIIISTDADTIYESDWLAVTDKWFHKFPDVVAVCGPIRYIGGPIWGSIYPHLLFGLVSLIYKITGYTFYASATNIAFKKSKWKSYNTSLTQGGDELALIQALRKEGRVAFNNYNASYTSARRLVRGFIYNIFVSFLLYYIIEYYLSKIFKRPIIGAAPKFRNELSPRLVSLINIFIYTGLLLLFVIYTSPGRHIFHQIQQVIQNTEGSIREKL